MKLTDQERLKVAKFTKKLVESRIIKESVNPMQVLQDVEEFDGDDMYRFLDGLADYFKINADADALGNMDAITISKLLKKAAHLVNSRTGN